MGVRGDAPTLDDAQRAADALMACGARRVLLFGSLARGEQREHSDIDLVAEFADMEYRQRHKLEARLRQAASAACGYSVDVIATDQPEWRIQTERVTKSFASAICEDVAVLAECADIAEQSGDADDSARKEQLMPTSNEQLAAQRLSYVERLVGRLRWQTMPGPEETRAKETGDTADYDLLRGERLVSACSTAHLVVENSLKAVGVLTDLAAKALWQHDVGQLTGAIATALPPDEADAFRLLLDSQPELVHAPSYITMWRTLGSYGTATDGRTAAEVATGDFTRALTQIAADSADAAATWCAAHGVGSGQADAVLWQVGVLRDRLASSGAATG